MEEKKILDFEQRKLKHIWSQNLH